MRKSIWFYNTCRVLLLILIASSHIPVASASLPYPDIVLAQTVYTVGEPVTVRVRILTMSGVPTQISGFRLVFNTPAGAKIHDIEPINSDTWYQRTVNGITSAPGTYSVVGQLPAYGTNTNILTFTVKAPQDFSLSVTPTSVTLKQGEKVTLNVAVIPVGEFLETVTLRVTGLPKEVTAAFSRQSEKPPLVSTLTLEIPTSTLAGNYSLSIEADGKIKTRSAKVSLNVEKKPSQFEQLFGTDLSIPIIAAVAIVVLAFGVLVSRRPQMLRRRKSSTQVPRKYTSSSTTTLSTPESSKYCVGCGLPIPQRANYCGKCGTYQE